MNDAFCDSCGFEYTYAEPARSFGPGHRAYYSAKLNTETRARLDAGVPTIHEVDASLEIEFTEDESS